MDNTLLLKQLSYNMHLPADHKDHLSHTDVSDVLNGFYEEMTGEITSISRDPSLESNDYIVKNSAWLGFNNPDEDNSSISLYINANQGCVTVKAFDGGKEDYSPTNTLILPFPEADSPSP